MGTVCAKRKCARKIAVFPYDVCMYIWTPLNPQTGILVKAVVFYERYHAPAIMLFLSLNVMFWNVHFRLVIKYIYFTTNIFKNGWMENKEISFFYSMSLVYCRIVLLLLLERDKTLLYTVMKQFLPMYPFQLYCFFNRQWSLVTFSQNRYWDALNIL